MEDYSFSRVTSIDDVHDVATAFMRAVQHTDTFWEMTVRYGPGPPLDALVKLLKQSVEKENHHVFKVVHKPSGEVVGMAQWKAPCYVEIEKVDPFAKELRQTEAMNDAIVAPFAPVASSSDDPANAAGVAMMKDTRRQITNAYITHIRGKKHVFLGRLGVVSEHRRKGIASRLMQWGTEFADTCGLVSYLNGRPSALKLYETFGYRAVEVTYFEFDDLEVPPVTSMLRLPMLERRHSGKS